MENGNKKRETFSSGLAVFFATLGSALGLGNIWKFPYLTGVNGGGAFLFAYLICVLLVGIPVMVSEFFIGRSTRKNIMGAIKALTPNWFWRLIAVFGVLAAYFIMFFYSDVAGWVYYYVFKSLTGRLSGATVDSASKLFGKSIVGPFEPIIWQLIVLVVVSAIIIAGVKKGIERVTKTLIPVLFVLIIIIDIRSLTLPNAMQGVNFLFHVDFSKLTPVVLLAALGLAFFKLSLGMGTMTTYGSYITEDTNMIANAAKVAVADSVVSILAGLAIFPAVFSFGIEPTKGASLLFITLPMIFAKIPFGGVLLFAFFLLTAIVATTAMISIVECVTAYFSEEFKCSRTKAVIINALIIAGIGVLATLSADSSALLGNIKIPFWDGASRGFFDTFDFLSSNILLPLGGLLIVLFVGWFTDKNKVEDELTNHGLLKNKVYIDVFYVITKFVAPLLIVIVFLSSIGVLDKIIVFIRSIFKF